MSVLIPTFNRRKILVEKTLPALETQDLGRELFEVVIVDDGSTDGTGEAVEDYSRNSRMIIRLLRQENAGPAAARNLAIKSARSELLVVIGDDTIPKKPTFVSAHCRHHELYPDAREALVGLTVWDATIKNPFMQWLEEAGMQFDYGRLKPRTYVHFRHLYTSNLSLKRSLILDSGEFLDERFKSAAYEDTEWGHRLATRCRMLLQYSDQAVLSHFHTYSQSQFLERLCASDKLFDWLRREYPDCVKALELDRPVRPTEAFVRRLLSSRWIVSLVPPDTDIMNIPAPLRRYVFALLRRQYRTKCNC